MPILTDSERKELFLLRYRHQYRRGLRTLGLVALVTAFLVALLLPHALFHVLFVYSLMFIVATLLAGLEAYALSRNPHDVECSVERELRDDLEWCSCRPTTLRDIAERRFERQSKAQ